MSSLVIGVAHRWNDVLQAVLGKKNDPLRFQRVFIGGIQTASTETRSPAKKKPAYAKRDRPLKTYPLGVSFPNVSFTRREAECMVLLLRGYTNTEVAACLGLSARTVEFYVKNMRHKTDCASKAHLVKSMLAINFSQNPSLSVEK